MRERSEITDRIYAFALQGNVRQAIVLLDSLPPKEPGGKIGKMRGQYVHRFVDGEDPQPPPRSDSGAVAVLRIFQRYWRDALMKAAPDSTLDERLIADLSGYLVKNYGPAANLSLTQAQDEIDSLYLGYLRSRGYHSTEFGKTGNLYDMLVWAEQREKEYSVRLPGGVQHVKVVFMDKFLTLGWEDFATFGTAYPGGWTKPEALYCVRAAYDTASEDFHVCYLTHEAQHYADNARYPLLQQPDLEYRAKLAELCQVKKMKDKLIGRFIVNALDDTTQAHSFADHCLVRDLSRRLFGEENVNDRSRWKSVGPKAVNAAACELLLANTAALDQIKDVERYLR